MRHRTCANCWFWDADAGGETAYGLCRRYAPRPEMSVTAVETVYSDFENPAWPQTSALEWCGEWEGPDDG